MAAGICYGRTDLPLAGDADACARQLRPLLPVSAPLYASPLARARQLAEQLHAAPIYDPRLVELDFGDWEMCPWQQIDRRQLDAWAADPLGFAPPGGESVAAMRARVLAFLAELPGEAVLVTHAGVIKLCLAHLTAAPLAQWLGRRFAYGAASLIEDGTLVWCDRLSA